MMIALLALPALLAATDSLMAPGVSLALARYRAARISGVTYDITLSLANRDTASGRVRVGFRRTRGDLILDFRGYGVTVVDVNRDSTVRGEYNGAHLRVPASRLRVGANSVTLTFISPIKAAGASVIRFTDDTDQHDYFYTLLVPSDANLLFPCFDQPDIKARFRLGIREGQVPGRVLTNARRRAAGDLGERTGKATGVELYGPTKPISTYLFAVAAGPWEVLRDSRMDMSLWVRRSRAREVDADTLLALHRRSRDWLASYFGVPYPFGKMDFLLAPAFPFGGMEHPGAIFYNEESFIFREPPTLVQKLGRQATINHEVAHQWFGDFTTMKWFDDLWMKEGFATYMSAKMQHAMGDSTAWMSFYLRNKPTAYDVDVTAGTTPVWQELANLDQAKSNYGAIVYNKAPAVLKQLDYLVGDQAFRAGVSAFLKAHAYGNATWRELLASVGAASKRDLTAWGEAYFVRPGMPILEQELRIGGDGRIVRLALIQRPAQSLSGKGAWPMKVEVLLHYSDGRPAVRLPVEMRAETTLVTAARGLPAPAFVYPNANDYGYGLFMLDARSVDYLLTTGTSAFGPRLSGLARDPFLRAMVWGSLWDLVRDARLKPTRYVDAALGALALERDEQIVSRLLGRVGRAVGSYLRTAEDAEDVEALKNAEAALLRGATDSTKSYGVRKSFFDSYVSVARTSEALSRLDAWLDSTRAAGEPLRQPTRWNIVTTLVARGSPSADTRLAAETARDTTTGGKRRAFIAAAAKPTAQTKRAYFTRYFGDSTLNEDWVTASLGAFNDPDQSTLTLEYLRPALDTLQWIQKNRRIFFLGRWLEAFIGGHRSPEALAIVDRFLEEHPELPRDLRQKVLQARDDLERTVRIRRT